MALQSWKDEENDRFGVQREKEGPWGATNSRTS